MIDLRTLAKENGITSLFGNRTLRGLPDNHTGIDIVLRDPNVPFVLGGTIISSGYNASAGNYVKIEQTDGTIATYMHLKHLPTWKKYDVVEEGQTVGIMGSTGNSTGAHIHYQVQTSDGSYINPALYFDYYNEGRTDPVGDYVAEFLSGDSDGYVNEYLGNSNGDKYSLLGDIVRFIIILLVCIASIYLILKAFDITKLEV